jgi:NAD(P)-dependent dehydrogenase (short-subunit alcohol dehydrogenase family)
MTSSEPDHQLTAFDAQRMSRSVLITGAGTRLGKTIACHLAQGGWQVVVHYRGSEAAALTTAAACTQLNPQAPAFTVQADLANEAGCDALIASVVDKVGQLGAVVNSAALFENDDAQTVSQDVMDAHWQTNTMAPVRLTQRFFKHLESVNACGAVVNLLDQKLWNLNPDFFSYTLSKSALKTATTLLAQALAPRLRVVGVAPGLTLTSHMLSDDAFQALHKLSPLGRSSTPEDVAATVAFALSNGSLTGTTLLVDGGQHLMKFDRDFSLM